MYILQIKINGFSWEEQNPSKWTLWYNDAVDLGLLYPKKGIFIYVVRQRFSYWFIYPPKQCFKDLITHIAKAIIESYQKV